MVVTSTSLADQRAAVKAIEEAGGNSLDNATAGEDEWFVISLEWFGAWKSAVDYAETGSGSGKEPGPIDNSAVATGNRLHNASALGATFEVVPTSIWDLLVEWCVHSCNRAYEASFTRVRTDSSRTDSSAKTQARCVLLS